MSLLGEGYSRRLPFDGQIDELQLYDNSLPISCLADGNSRRSLLRRTCETLLRSGAVEIDNDAVLAHLLTEQGCSLEEIEHILRKLREHDQRTIRESVFDSVEAGRFDLKALIEEARDELETS